ncbi:hypothetical protein MVEN_00174200 [Mycena venus]|uniref:Uncharacterized protein n=1 Tax=Mycena venus TaxID=2733690 RepID=A0A8H6Z3A0_9AGAR|nr:hypothetical protein MVEN_00174200 [Mycena venus]
MTSSLLLIFSFLSAARAANDWNTPCLTGVCSYDLPSGNGANSSGTMQIWGSKTAIGDITPAAGWEILGCSPDALTQDIRLVCTGKESMCQHLYEGHGAADTIVRLPENCGKSPFARIQKAWVPADQSIPASIAARMVRRDGSQPQVQAVTLDTNFAAADNNKTGAVNLAIKGVNVPELNDVLNSDTTASQRRSRLNRRGVQSFVADAANSISNAISSANSVSINKSKALPAADFSKKVSLFETSLECPPITAEASVGLDATAHAVVTIGVAASGTIVPPKITDFSLLASLTADLNGELQLKAELSGKLDSGNKLLFETGIPGLDFPGTSLFLIFLLRANLSLGILSVGPTFQVNARGTATAELAADLTLGINYHVNGAKMSFPSGGQSGGSFSLGDTPLKLSADTKVEATTTVEAHLIPSINFGISALDVATANVALSLDASATMVLKVEAKAGASATVQQANKKRQDDFDDGSSDDGSSDDTTDDSGDDSSTDDSTDSDFDSGDSSDTSDQDDGTTDEQDSGSDDSGDSDAASGDDQDADIGTDDEQNSASDGDEDQTDSQADDGSDNTDSNGDDASQTDDTSDQSADGSDQDEDDQNTASDGDEDQTDSQADDGSDNTDSNGDDATQTDDTSDQSADGSDQDETDDGSGLDGANNSTSTDTSLDGDDDDDDDLNNANNSTSIDTGDNADADNSTATTTSTSDPTATSATATSSSAPIASVTKAAEASFGGSFVISGGLDLSASATGTFFGLFDASKKLSLFKKSFQLFSKSFGDEGDAAEGGGDESGSDGGDADTADSDSDSDVADSDNSDSDSDSDERRSLPTRSFRSRRVTRAQRFALYSRGLECLKEGGESKDLADETIPGKSL